MLDAELILLSKQSSALWDALAAPRVNPDQYASRQAMREQLGEWLRVLEITCRALEWSNVVPDKSAGPSPEKRAELWHESVNREIRALGGRYETSPDSSDAYSLNADQRQGLKTGSYTNRGGRYKPLKDALRGFEQVLAERRALDEPSLPEVRYFILLSGVLSRFRLDADERARARDLLPRLIALRKLIDLRKAEALREWERANGVQRDPARARFEALRVLSEEATTLDVEICDAFKGPWSLSFPLPQEIEGRYVVPSGPLPSLSGDRTPALRPRFLKGLESLEERYSELR
jgi:hypothetical protein